MLYVNTESGLQNVRFELPGGQSSDLEDSDQDHFNDEAVDEKKNLPVHGWNIIKTAHSIGKDINVSHPPKKRAKLEEVGFLGYSLAALENVDKYFDNRDMGPLDFSWTAEECCKNASPEDLARLFFEIRPFLPINPLDELIDRLGSTLEGHPCDVIANVGFQILKN